MAPAEQVVFASSFEGLFSKDLRALVTPTLDAELRKRGLALDKPFQPAYPVAKWAEVLEVLARHLHAADAREAAYWKLGRATVHGYSQTLLGRAAVAMMKLIGPVRTLERATRSFANTNNYTVATLTRVGPTEFDLHLNATATPPQFDMGVVEAILEQVGVQELQVSLVGQDPAGFTMHLTWK